MFDAIRNEPNEADCPLTVRMPIHSPGVYNYDDDVDTKNTKRDYKNMIIQEVRLLKGETN
jgi:hypothetical protein